MKTKRPSNFFMKVRLLHDLELSTRPIRVANSFNSDYTKKPPKTFLTTKFPPKTYGQTDKLVLEQLHIINQQTSNAYKNKWDTYDVHGTSGRWVPVGYFLMQRGHPTTKCFQICNITRNLKTQVFPIKSLFVNQLYEFEIPRKKVQNQGYSLN